jgi:hypothetical protein
MSEKKQDKKQYQVTNPTIPQAAMVINGSAKEKMKDEKSGAVESEGFNDVNDATMTTAW